PLAIMSGNLVSAMRTGAVAGVGAKHLARKGSEIVGLIGGGVINKACLRAIVSAVPNIKKCLLFELIPERAKAFVQDLEEELKIQIECTSTEKEVLKQSDIVSYASAGAKKPVICEDLLKEGVLVTVTAGVEMSDSFLLNSKIVVDNIKMHLAYLHEKDEHPDGYKRVLNLPSGPLLKLIVEEKICSSEISNLGDVISKKEIGRDNEKEKIIFFSGGMPTYDLAWAFTVFDKARKMGLGKDLVVWNEPQWF
ncbi:MAG: ornithine cyclodeaminase, partial [Bacteroidales bacterium]|nr:ornithine cyclodeaminase [Bacteroidales bacterium]